MASNKTPNLNLDIWQPEDFFKRSEVNNNFTKIDEKVGVVTSQLSEKATKEELNNLGQLKLDGTYTSLTDLKNAHPTGTEGLYLVTDDGYMYRWDGLSWVQAALFQSTGVAYESVDYVKTTFLTPGKNLFNKDTRTFGVFLIETTGLPVKSPTYDTSDFIPVKAGVPYAITRCRKINFYDESKQRINGIDVSSVPTTVTPTANGYMRVSFYAVDINTSQVEVGSSNTAYEDFGLIINGFNGESLIGNSVPNSALKGSIPLTKTDFMLEGKNKINTDTDTVGYYINNSSGQLLASASYNTTDFIEVTNGVSYTISPRIRKLLGYDFSKQAISSTYVDATLSNYVFNSTFDGYIKITYYASDKATIQMENGTTPTPYEPHVIKTVVPLELHEKSIHTSNIDDTLMGMINTGVDPVVFNPVYGKSLLNFGDSIAAGDGNGGTGYAELIATKNTMTIYDRAVGGATVSIVEGKHRVITQVNNAIANGLTADYILFNGGTNDAIEGRTTAGTISTGYDATLDTTTFCGAFEELCKTLKLNWLGKKIVYVRVHNMSSRDDLQITYGDLALEICKKWSIPYVDLYSEGGLNTQIPEMKNAYTASADATHPNANGYNIYYVPQIEAKMKSI